MLIRDIHTNPSVANPDVKVQGVQYERNPEAEYGEHIVNTAAVCNTSAAHTYGNVLAVVEQYLLNDVFKKQDIFKTVVASTELASRQLTHLPHQLRKKELPTMVLSSRIVFGQDENRFLGHTIMNDRITNTQSFWGEGSLIPLAEDKHRHLWVHGHYNRAVMYVDVVISFNTYSEQMNWMSYLYNTACVGHNKFIRAPLELYVPDGFCRLISNLAEVSLEGKNGISNFLSYMNSIWHYPITYKLKGGSNTDEFFMYYLADIDTVIQDPQPSSGVRDGQIRRNFDISFTVRCDFNTIGYFTLNSPNVRKQIYIPMDEKENSAIVPLFSDVIDLNDFDLPMGWTVLCWPIFKLKHGENKISIDNILNDSLRVVIDHHLKFSIPMERFINIQFRENGRILTDEMFYVDWVNRMLVVLEPNVRRTYRLIITVSHEYINNLIKELYNLE